MERKYKEKLVSAGEAVKCIESGDNVVVPFGAAESPVLLEAMVGRAREVENVRVHQMHPMSRATYLAPEMEKNFRHISWFTTGISREAVRQGRAGIMPAHFHDYPFFFKEHIDVDVFMGTVSPMDEHGFFSFGISVDYNTAAAQKARTVILAVNPNMPRTYGQTFIHLSQVDYIVEDNIPLAEIAIYPPDERDMAIGRFIAEQIEDGSTLQIGIGSIPNAVTEFLTGKRDLGIHSEMITQGMIELVESGAVNNLKKSIHVGKIIGCFALGTRKLYDFLDNNPLVEMYPVSYTNDPYTIARNVKMVSINATLEVDLLGQCASESIGPQHYSGTGGQVDFARGAVMSPGGKSFLVMHSTTSWGRSKIVPVLREGTVVTTGKNDVDHVVTEYGVAKLRGKTVRQRVLALIAIAHPGHRDELREAARRAKLI